MSIKDSISYVFEPVEEIWVEVVESIRKFGREKGKSLVDRAKK